MENKPANLLVVPLGKALSGIPPSWCGSGIPHVARRPRVVHPWSRVCGWFDAELRSLQKEKRIAYVRSLRKNDLESQLAYHRIRNHYDRIIKTKKSQYFQKRLASSRNDLKQTWSVINGIIGKKSSISPNCIKGDDKLLTNSFEIAESFNDHFSSIGSKL